MYCNCNVDEQIMFEIKLELAIISYLQYSFILTYHGWNKKVAVLQNSQKKFVFIETIFKFMKDKLGRAE